MILVKDENGNFKPYTPEPFEIKYPVISIEIITLTLTIFVMFGAGAVVWLIYKGLQSIGVF